MRRALAIALLLAAAAPAHAQTPPLAARLAACETGPQASDRFAVFSGSMPRDGAAAMAMRFDLYERAPGGAFEHVALSRWGTWEKTARKGVPGFIFTKRVEQLAAPAAFRAAVSFRWYDAKGRVIRSERRTSPSCRQPDWRPDLHVKRVIFPTGTGPTKVVVRNRGRGAADAFGVTVSRSDLVRAASLPGLPAGQEATVSVPLGRCKPGEDVTVVLDAAGAVDEARETDDTVTVPCPNRR